MLCIQSEIKDVTLILFFRVLCIQNAQVNPIFHSESPVIDISNGSLYMLQALLERSSFNLVMYYTHWCAQSRKLVYEFHRASKKFKGQVRFLILLLQTFNFPYVFDEIDNQV